MSTYTVVDVCDEESQKQFLALPHSLYSPDINPCNPREEKAILEGTDVLSKYYTCKPFMVLDEKKQPLARCALFIFDGSTSAFLGMFEAYDRSEAVAILMEHVKKVASTHGITQLVGPVDGSIWRRYRFREPSPNPLFALEPHNPDYYIRLWEESGFQTQVRFYSLFASLKDSHPDEEGVKALERARELGYTIKHTSFFSFPASLKRIFVSLSNLFSVFPGYFPITWDEFKTMFGGLRYVLAYNAVFELFDREKNFAGFLVFLPDYGTALNGSLTMRKIAKIIATRFRPRRYVAMYMGVEPEHRGLGSALAEQARADFARKGRDAIAGLVREGNSSGRWHKDAVTGKTTYVLMACVLKNIS